MRSPFFKILFFLLAAILITLLAGYIVMFLWNMIFPAVANIQALNYQQGIALFILSKILFGGWTRGGRGWHKGGRQWQEKWGEMSPEDREKWKSEWKKRCGKEE